MTEDYPVFGRWYKLLDWILDRCEGFPRSVRFSYATRVADLSLEVMEGIIEAIYTKRRAHILDGVNIRLEKLRVFFRLGFKRRYLSSSQYEYISGELEEVGRMIGGWRKRCAA